VTRSPEYDQLAWFYDRYWGPRFHDAARPALESLLYPRLVPGDPVAELCCGSGHLTEELVARGYRVTGIDNSIEMLRCARRRAPEARLVCADVASSPLIAGRFTGAVSTFDSINHLVSPEAVKSTFEFAHRLLRTGSVFVFDVNTEAAYRSEWTKSSAVVEPDAALFVRGSFDETARIGRTLITMFRLLEGWQRLDVEVVQRCYDEGELAGWLFEAGFRDAAIHGAAAIGMTGDLARGRVFLIATK
jgi:SAM-dependent methyltransferase